MLLAWTFPKEGAIEIGVLGKSTCLNCAMAVASCKMVTTLLNAGANVEAVDIVGCDPLMSACAFKRFDNVKMWLTRFKSWNINRRSLNFGSTVCFLSVSFSSLAYIHTYIYTKTHTHTQALNMVLYAGGTGQLEMVKYLVEEVGARVHSVNSSGTSGLILACEAEDSDPAVVRM